MPQSLQKDGGLYFPHCDPEVVETLIRYMESDRQSDLSEYQIEFDNKITASLPPYTQDPIFYLRLYKLAGSLAYVIPSQFLHSVYRRANIGDRVVDLSVSARPLYAESALVNMTQKLSSGS